MNQRNDEILAFLLHKQNWQLHMSLRLESLLGRTFPPVTAPPINPPSAPADAPTMSPPTTVFQLNHEEVLLLG